MKRPSRWLEKRSGAVSSRPTAIPGEPPAHAPAPVVPVVAVSAEPAVEETFDDDAADFFRTGESAPPTAMHELDEERHDAAHGPRGAASAIAIAAAARRRAFSRHVLGVVVLSVVVCIAAFVRSATATPPSAATAAIAMAAQAPVAPPTPAATTATGAIGAAVAAPAEAPAAVATVAPEPAAAPSVAPEPATERSPVAARTAREEARRLLEAGAAAGATAAAIRSVELDPSDAEAWLILGAAYQLAGNGTEARNAFRSCSKLATRGGVGECRAFVP